MARECQAEHGAGWLRAELRQDTAEQTPAKARADQRESDLQRRAWLKVDAVVERDAAAAAADEHAQTAVDVAEQETAPCERGPMRQPAAW